MKRARRKIYRYFLSSYSYYIRKIISIYDEILGKIKLLDNEEIDNIADQNFDLGMFFRMARIEAGFTIDEIAYKLKTKKENIIDLEDNNFNSISIEVYLYDLINRYKNFLNVDIPVDINLLISKIFHKDTNINYTYEKNISNNKIDFKFVKYGILIFLFILLVSYIFANPDFVHNIEYFKRKLK